MPTREFWTVWNGDLWADDYDDDDDDDDDNNGDDNNNNDHNDINNDKINKGKKILVHSWIMKNIKKLLVRKIYIFIAIIFFGPIIRTSE